MSSRHRDDPRRYRRRILTVAAIALGLTFVVGYSAPFGGFVGSYGELLIDPSSSWAFTSVAFVGGGIASHSVAIPNDSNLAGAAIYTQGYLNSVAPAGQLTNAWDLILGY